MGVQKLDDFLFFFIRISYHIHPRILTRLMRKGILLVCAHWANATTSIELEKSASQLVDELGLRGFNASAYHQYDNFTEEDYTINYAELLKEYYEGSTSAARAHRYRSTPLRERTQNEDQEYIKRFLQLKYAIMFLQKTKSIGRYCFYGCWCLPNGAADLGLGTGPPVDNIDRSCREFATCYNCLYNQEIGGGCDADAPARYVIRGRTDPVTSKKTLYCMNAPGTCQRNRCECDRALAIKLSEYQDEWRQDYHRRRGSPPFDADAYCKIQVTEAQPFDSTVQVQQQVQHSVVSQAGGFEQQQDFFENQNFAAVDGGGGGGVGDEMTQTRLEFGQRPGLAPAAPMTGSVTINRFPSAPIYGAIIGCCGRSPDVRYFRQGQKCCGDGEIVDYGASCSLEFAWT